MRLNRQSMQRKNSIELLRCLLMMLIVFGHSCYYGALPWTKCYWLMAIILSIRWHVDAFVAISGWFGIKFRWSKVAKLIGVFAFYSCLSWCVKGRIGEVSGGWFGGTYLMLMFMAPLLNAGVECLIKESPRVALLAWSAFAAGMILNWLPHHAFTGCVPNGGGSHTILTLVFVYVTARMVSLAKSPILEQRLLRFCMPLSLGICMFGGGYCLMRHFRGVPLSWDTVKWVTDYNSPAIWLIAIALVVFFVRKVQLPVWLDRVVSFLAPSMFGVYLLHETTVFGHNLFRIPQAWMQAHWNMPAFFVIVISAVFTFCVGVCVDLCRRWMVYSLNQFMNAKKWNLV